MKVQALAHRFRPPLPGQNQLSQGLNDDAVDAVAESIRRFGFRQPRPPSAGDDSPLSAQIATPA